MIGIALGVAALLPGSYELKQVIDVSASRERIFPMIGDLSKWNSWSPWYQSEPEAEYIVTGQPFEPGNKMTWKGGIVGHGQIEILDIYAPESVNLKLNILKPQPLESNNIFTINANKNSSEIIWIMTGKLSYPFGRLFGSLVLGKVQTDMTKGLERIKSVAEQNKN